MKKYILSLALILFIVLVLSNPFKQKPDDQEVVQTEPESTESMADEDESLLSMANPASKYCEEEGGVLEIITNTDGSQFAMCQFEDYSCEEWTYFRDECDIEGDAQKIKEALIAKGLDLSDAKVMINKHLGEYIGGSVLPVSEPAGGGYVFAVKEDDEIKIVADGNGTIMCSSLEEYPDFPAYLIEKCVDESGNPVSR